MLAASALERRRTPQANGQSPNDWQFAFSRSRKRWYYFKPATGQSVFESPGELEACTPQLCDLAAPTNVIISHGPARPRLTPAEHLLWLKQVCAIARARSKPRTGRGR